MIAMLMVIEDVAGVMWVTRAGRAPPQQARQAGGGSAARGARLGSRCPRGRRCTSRRRSVEAASGRVPEALALQPFNLSIMLPGDGRENRLVSSLVTGDKNLQSQPPRKRSLQPRLRVGEEVQLQPLCDSRGEGGEEQRFSLPACARPAGCSAELSAWWISPEKPQKNSLK